MYMRITNVRINGIENPMGFIYEQLVCSWNVRDTKSRRQANASIEVSLGKDFQTVLYKKEGADLKQSGEKLELELKPRTTYFFRITVEGDLGDKAVSETCIFETGKMQEAWKAEWISTQKEDTFHPIMEKTFRLSKKLKRARLYAAGVGLFEAYLDGRKTGGKLGDEYLAPYVNNYEKNIQAMTFSMDDMLEENGENRLYFLLGKGWYMGTFGLEMQSGNYGSRMAVIAELHLEFEDGTKECICTDESWNYYGSDIEDSGIYFGEVCNRMLWEQKENPHRPVQVLEHPEEEEGTKNLYKSHLMDRISLPVLAKERILVQEILYTPAGETVLDMGQNFAGYLEFQADFPKGARVVFDFGEILQDGNFYNKNYCEAKSQYVYISGGKPETVRAHFTFFGFRYVRITGWEGICKKEDFTGRVLYSDLRRTGYITTGNEKINRLYKNTVWGLKSNFIDMPTDCQ